MCVSFSRFVAVEDNWGMKRKSGQNVTVSGADERGAHSSRAEGVEGMAFDKSIRSHYNGVAT
jgi:hypothetical protein